MDIHKEIIRIEEITVGFDIVLAEKKAAMILNMINYLNSNLSEIGNNISTEDAIYALQWAYGIGYEVGNTKQFLKSNICTEIAEKALSIARLIYGKSKDFLPYLNLCMNYAIRDKEKHQQYMKEIYEIENNE